MDKNKIYVGDALSVLRLFPDESINLFVTSSPYFQQRFYKEFPVLFGGDINCDHEFEILAAIRPPTPGDKPGPNSSVAGRYDKHYATIRPGRPSRVCTKCGGWFGNLGLEPHPDLFVEHLFSIFEECRRVLTSDGSLWWNMGHKYNGSGGAGSQYSEYRRQNRHTQFGNVVESDGCSLPTNVEGFKRKTMFAVPERLVVKMVDSGWIYRNEIIWTKPACTPFSGCNRLTVDFEGFYFFAKEPDHYFNQVFDDMKQPFLKKTTTYGGIQKGVEGYSNPTYRGRAEYDASKLKGKNMRTTKFIRGDLVLVDRSYLEWLEAGMPEEDIHMSSVWSINTAKFKTLNGKKHFAVFPKKLAKIPIMACCPPGGVVCDPFMGSGTTAIAANELDVDWIGIEINPEYADLAVERIEQSRKIREFKKKQVKLSELM